MWNLLIGVATAVLGAWFVLHVKGSNDRDGWGT